MTPINVPVVSYFGEPSIGAWESDLYNVFAFKDKDTIRLDIERKDERDGITWDELQNIKDSCGFEAFDAAEFYPAKKDVVNTANWRHLYVFSTGIDLIRRQSEGQK